MANKPNEDLYWANVFQTEQHTINGVLEDVPNRISLPAGFGDSGFLFQQPVPHALINQGFYLAGAWQRHLNERFSVGVVQESTISDNNTINTLWGGTWNQLGTRVVGAKTVYTWEKIA